VTWAHVLHYLYLVQAAAPYHGQTTYVRRNCFGIWREFVSLCWNNGQTCAGGRAHPNTNTACTIHHDGTPSYLRLTDLPPNLNEPPSALIKLEAGPWHHRVPPYRCWNGRAGPSTAYNQAVSLRRRRPSSLRHVEQSAAICPRRTSAGTVVRGRLQPTIKPYHRFGGVGRPVFPTLSSPRPSAPDGCCRNTGHKGSVVALSDLFHPSTEGRRRLERETHQVSTN